MAADAVTSTPVAVDRGWVKACRCTVAISDLADLADLAVVVVVGRDVAQAAAGRRAAMSGRPF